MNLLKYHHNNLVIQDYLLKYIPKNLKVLPSLKQLSLSAKFGAKSKASILSLFEILTFHKAYITQSRYNILSLNLRKGEPVGVKIVLRKKVLYEFLNHFIFNILPAIKDFNGLNIKNNLKNKNTFHMQIKDVFVYEQTYYLYIYLIDLNSFDIVIEGYNLNLNFFNACRFPINYKKN
jgi:large subunit ribosomal protein L5